MAVQQGFGRRWLLGAMLSGVALPLWAEPPALVPRPPRRPQPGEDRALRRLIEAANLSGTLAFVVADAASGRVLEARNEGVALPPASVVKAVTALYALDKLGPDHRFRTRVMATAQVVQGRLDGDLVLVGGGDPNLDTDRMGDLAAQLAATGLKEVTGRFLAYDAALPFRFQIAPDQPDHLGYNPAISGLILNYNRVNFEWARSDGGIRLGMDARGERFVPAVRMATATLADRALPLFSYSAGKDTDNWTVASPALNEAGSRWLPVRQPAVYAAEVFQTLCRAHGLRLPDAQLVRDLPPEARELVAHQGDALPEVLRDMLKFSTNLTAEAVGLTASGAGTLEGSAAAMTDWARRRLGLGGRFGDHSGLGPRSAMTVTDLMTAMLHAHAVRNGAMLRGVLREQGLADAEGKEIKASPVRVQAKSGTLNFVSNLAGYITAPDGRSLVFAIIAADPERRAAVPLHEREEPPGGPAWTIRARRLHQQLIRRWAGAYLG